MTPEISRPGDICLSDVVVLSLSRPISFWLLRFDSRYCPSKTRYESDSLSCTPKSEKKETKATTSSTTKTPFSSPSRPTPVCVTSEWSSAYHWAAPDQSTAEKETLWIGSSGHETSTASLERIPCNGHKGPNRASDIEARGLLVNESHKNPHTKRRKTSATTTFFPCFFPVSKRRGGTGV